MIDLLAYILGKVGIDKTVASILATRGFQAFAGLISVLMIVHFFSPEEQGYYYTFLSLIALQSFLELGFYSVIINVASHEWSKLSTDKNRAVSGDETAMSRLKSLILFVLKWYSVIGALFVSAISIAGYIFLSRSGHENIDWETPWLVLVVFTGLNLCLGSMQFVLEGCNQVKSINLYRLTQHVASSLVAWTVIALGGKLWALPSIAMVNFAAFSIFLGLKYRHFFTSILAHEIKEKIDWKLEIWPMQWRIGIQGVFSYFLFSMFVPVMFHYHGAVVAGQMGLTLNLTSTIQGMALAWVQSKVPQFGIHIARNETGSLNFLWRQSVMFSLGFVACGSASLIGLLYGLGLYFPDLAVRFLPVLPSALFLGAVFFTQIIQCQAAYIRAHKCEKLVVPSVVASSLMGLTVWLLGSHYGAIGAATANVSVIIAVWIPLTTLIFVKFRKERQQAL